MKHRKFIAAIFLSLSIFMAVNPVFAHVVVNPDEAGVASFQTFTVSVPNERESITTALRLVMPDGLGHVKPNVKSGWNIEVVTEGFGDDARVSEINWIGGEIPQDMRDDFVFSAQVPSDETVLVWKAYQTYSDGSVVSWEITDDKNQPTDETGNPDFSEYGPASETTIVNDLSETEEDDKKQDNLSDQRVNLPVVLSLTAVVVSAVALVKTRK